MKFYHALDNNDIEVLKEIVGTEDVLIDESELHVYSLDTTPIQGKAEVVVRPESTEEVSRILRYASQKKIPVTPRGASTGTAGGAVPVRGGILLDLSKMDRIIEIDIPNRVVVVQPGVIHDRLNKELGKLGYQFPPNPGSTRMCTIGGQVAIGGSGSRAVKSGVTRNYVLGLEVVLPDGSVFRTGGKYHKNATGVDLTHLFIGSEGTLGVITEIILKIVPKPEKIGVVAAAFDSVYDAQKTVEMIFDRGIIPDAVEFIDQSMIRCLNSFDPDLSLPDAEIMLFFEIGGYGDEVKEMLKLVTWICKKQNAQDVKWSDDEESRKKIWNARSAAGAAVGRLNPRHSRVYLGAEDLIVPPSEIGNLLKGIEKISIKYGVEIQTYGHFAEGNVHPGIAIDQTNERDWQVLEKIVQELYSLVLRLGGTVSGEHGIGATRGVLMKDIIGMKGFELIKKIKEIFDPHNIMNPGKLGFE